METAIDPWQWQCICCGNIKLQVCSLAEPSELYNRGHCRIAQLPFPNPNCMVDITTLSSMTCSAKTLLTPPTSTTIAFHEAPIRCSMQVPPTLKGNFCFPLSPFLTGKLFLPEMNYYCKIFAQIWTDEATGRGHTVFWFLA